MSLTSPIVLVLGLGWLCLAGQLVAALRFARRPLPAAARAASISVLKPLHGAEPGLYENLRSFVEQDYPAIEAGVQPAIQPAVQIVLGVNHPEDGALHAARALIRDFPAQDIALVVDRRIRGSNQKVANLENMMAAARHDVLVLADSDMRVDPRYLAAVAAPLGDARVGVVTCLYKGASTGGFWSDLGALQINFGFLPNALLGGALGIGGGCFGATIALRHATLGRIGGFARLRDELADDQRIGGAVRAQGLAVVLSPYLVEARVWEPSLVALWRHELRWARTVRGIAPVGFAGSAATHPLAIALLAAGIAGFGSTAGVLFAVTCVLRWMAAGTMAHALGLPVRRLWLLPLRDVLSFAVFVASFFGRRVSWRDQNLYVEPNGRMTVVDGEKAL
jgi:ceramide glucosyltransferase